ncbi:recombination protein RecR [Candidatus Falkowbacteria bacterium]|nr:recombination protein RecR [Candidatus Falkowbacteria bacterium]
MRHPENIQKLIDAFMQLPGVGPKTAERYVYHLIRQPKQLSFAMSAAINNVANSITTCNQCHAISQTNPCLICANQARNNGTICVVSDTHDSTAIESLSIFHGRYHILNGSLDPVHGITADKLTINQLVQKLQTDTSIKEVILALNPDIEGETTMSYIKKLLTVFPVKITRLALGLPTGADLEYADPHTLTKALNNRTNV